MRVTEALMYGRMGRSNTMARYRLERSSQPLMSGHAIERPSEDPLLANRVEQAKRGARRLDRFQANIDRTRVYYQSVETAVSGVVDNLSELNSIAISMVNGALDANNRATAAAQVNSLLESLRAASQTQHDGKYIFSGRLENTPAYDATDTYQGDAVGRTVSVADGYAIQADMSGFDVFGDPGTGDPTAFQAAKNLEAALLANDTNLIAAAMTEIQTAHKNATMAWTEVGTRMDEMQRFDDIASDRKITYQVQEAELIGADYAQAASEMQFAETVYQASLSASSRLMDILKLESRL